jgi:hypothetical protein
MGSMNERRKDMNYGAGMSGAKLWRLYCAEAHEKLVRAINENCIRADIQPPEWEETTSNG